MKSIWNEFKQVDKNQDLLLVFNKLTIFWEPSLANHTTINENGTTFKDITNEIYQFTETLLLQYSKSSLFIKKQQLLSSLCADLQLSPVELKKLLNIWIFIIKEECRRSWTAGTEQIVQNKLESFFE